MKAGREWGKSPEEFEALSQNDQADMIAFTRVNLQMLAWEHQEQQKEMDKV